jgi:LysM repeat protein
VAANPQIKNVDLIYPGDILTIPVTASYTPSRTTPFFYVVSAGETAATIAAKFEMTADTLVGANPGMSLGAGVTLLVPAGPHLYPIKAGDTLPGIAALYNTTEANLANFSNVPNPDRIYAGQQIFIPVIYNSKPMPF